MQFPPPQLWRRGGPGDTGSGLGHGGRLSEARSGLSRAGPEMGWTGWLSSKRSRCWAGAGAGAGAGLGWAGLDLTGWAGARTGVGAA